MMPGSTDNTGALSFTQDFIEKNRDRLTPEAALNKTRYERWPTTWENRVLGVPSMEVTSEERRSNYMNV
jgi:hypothetical protein